MQSMPIIAEVAISIIARVEVYSIQAYVLIFVSDVCYVVCTLILPQI